MGKLVLAGLTTNERLFEIGMMAQFDAARDLCDDATMRRLLELAEIEEPSIALILADAADSA